MQIQWIMLKHLFTWFGESELDRIQWMLNFGEYTQYGLNDVQTWKANCLGNNIRLENFL